MLDHSESDRTTAVVVKEDQPGNVANLLVLGNKLRGNNPGLGCTRTQAQHGGLAYLKATIICAIEGSCCARD